MNGNELKDLGLQRVEDGANLLWFNTAVDAIRMIKKRTNTITSDSVWRYMEKHHPDLQTPNNSAMGAVFRTAFRKNYIKPSNTFVPSSRPTAHARLIRVWLPNKK